MPDDVTAPRPQRRTKEEVAMYMDGYNAGVKDTNDNWLIKLDALVMYAELVKNG